MSQQGYKPFTNKEFFDKFKTILNLENTNIYKFTSQAYSSKDNDVFIFTEEKGIDVYFQCPDYKNKLIPTKRNYIYKLPKNTDENYFYKCTNSKDGFMYKVKLNDLIRVYTNPYNIAGTELIYDASSVSPMVKLEGTIPASESVGCLNTSSSSDTHIMTEEEKQRLNIGFIETPTPEQITPLQYCSPEKANKIFDELGIYFKENPELGNIEHPQLVTESILLEAESIVNGERNAQYNDPKISFKLYSDICNTAFGIELSPSDVAKVMIAIKLGREKYKHKRDNLVDLTGYTEILNRLLED